MSIKRLPPFGDPGRGQRTGFTDPGGRPRAGGSDEDDAGRHVGANRRRADAHECTWRSDRDTDGLICAVTSVAARFRSVARGPGHPNVVGRRQNTRRPPESSTCAEVEGVPMFANPRSAATWAAITLAAVLCAGPSTSSRPAASDPRIAQRVARNRPRLPLRSLRPPAPHRSPSPWRPTTGSRSRTRGSRWSGSRAVRLRLEAASRARRPSPTSKSRETVGAAPRSCRSSCARTLAARLLSPDSRRGTTRSA